MTCNRTLGILIALGTSSVATAMPWDVDMADSQAIKAYEAVMQPLPPGVVSQPNILTPQGFSPNIDRMKILANPALLPNPVKRSPDVLETGEKMFATYCTPCHGDGHTTLGPVAEPGRFVGVVDLAGDAGAIQSKPDGYVYLTIRNGGVLMPYYGWAMNDAEMWSIVHYLRTLPNGRFKTKQETP